MQLKFIAWHGNTKRVGSRSLLILLLPMPRIAPGQMMIYTISCRSKELQG